MGVPGAIGTGEEEVEAERTAVGIMAQHGDKRALHEWGVFSEEDARMLALIDATVHWREPEDL